MDLQKRLQEAIDRGQSRAQAKPSSDPAKMTPEQLKNLHNDFRLTLSAHAEEVMRQIVDQLPGFNSETLFGDKGWGAAIFRDDLVLNRTLRKSEYSRLEIFVRPISDYFVVDLASKATVRNKEIWNRTFFRPIVETDAAAMMEQIDGWAVQFAEQYSASQA